MIHKLKNTSVRELIRALEKDGFKYTRRKGSQRVYRTRLLEDAVVILSA
jgi:predicted RNA binding protein YcfA (HicA-like mRNA interferase family)